MTGVGQKNGVAGVGSSGGSSFDGTDGVESFPEVPYSKSDFNDGKCSGNIGPEDYGSNAGNVRNCRLVGLLDLDQSKTYVRGKIIGYLNNLIDIGVAGFRFDASKHMWPEDLGAILDGMKNLRQDVSTCNSGNKQMYAPLEKYIVKKTKKLRATFNRPASTMLIELL
ncbi:hypothetical protein OESDEN_06242 [Oesophagostomum dentatum]|uniref:Alpha-amylase n=1 Tax=Oesophagostomum dentatum TaxID=61180 RepID=A0A0B1T8E8_OESDE|nr:hypothetical protein OESDEN_06242 [Oesophagostomum dentatum]